MTYINSEQEEVPWSQISDLHSLADEIVKLATTMVATTLLNNEETHTPRSLSIAQGATTIRESMVSLDHKQTIDCLIKAKYAQLALLKLLSEEVEVSAYITQSWTTAMLPGKSEESSVDDAMSFWDKLKILHPYFASALTTLS